MVMPERPAILEVEDEELRRRTVHAQLGQPLERCRDLLWSALGDASWRVRKEAVEVLVAARPGQDQIDALIELLRNEENAGLRNATAEVLVRLGRRALPALTAHLQDRDHDLRKLAVDTLAAIGDRSAVAGLITALNDSDVNVAAAAAEALGTIGDRSAVPALLQALERHSHDFFRFNALTALGRVGVPGPLPPAVAALAGQEMLRLAVYECLGRIGGDTAAADILIKGVQLPMPSVRAAALRSLAAVLQHLEPPFRQSVVEQLRAVADQGLLEALLHTDLHADQVLAEAAVVLLEALGDSRGVPVLLKAMGDERLTTRALAALQTMGASAYTAALACFDRSDEVERAAICNLVAQTGQGGEAVERVIGQALSDDAPLVRRKAALAAGALSSVDLVAPLTSLLDDENPSVRDAALYALRQRCSSDGELIRTVAAQMVAAESSERRRAAALLCAASGDSEQLARLIKDEDPQVREAAVRVVGRLGLTGVSSHLVMALVDEAEDVRIAAAEALGGCCGPAAAVEPLRLALQDASSWVQAAALRSLVEQVGEAALPDAMALWQRGDEVAQLACLEVFGLIAAPEGFALISQALGQRDGEVLKGAIEILARHAPDLLTPWLNHIFGHYDWDVRMSAVRACVTLPDQERELLLRTALDREDNDLVRQAIQQLLDNH